MTMAFNNLFKLFTGSGLKKRTWQDICSDVLRLKDDAMVLKLADEILLRYQNFTDEEKLDFFQFLLTEFGADQAMITTTIDAYLADPSPNQLQQLNLATRPSRRKFFEILNMCTAGMRSLLEMRVTASRLAREYPELAAIDGDLEILLRNWFNRGLLTLQRIDWHTPAFVLEKLIEYEAVHEITGWDDLRMRVSRGRRCYAFFHPVLPGEPIIFVQVALTNGMVSNIAELIGETAVSANESDADTAIFYSISNCQVGLRGIAFGDMLIKQVTDLITAESPFIKSFATLSPVPGFAKWVDRILARDDDADQVAKLEQLKEADWSTDQSEIKQWLLPLCAQYLTSTDDVGRPLNSVARFHLRNGARLERICWQGHVATHGIEESYGLLVNYVYDLASVTKNHESYVYDEVVVTSSSVKQLAKKAGNASS